ncbi:hypothetical protein AWB79_02413 [Caballeronia hypogeia]|uniref:Uncharacterized protein n=1 Tax=Caballeronia hypogeia TaxID=1777140 RepID=A0A158AIR0_9BURK|nr:hypothetical protein AWB79_02413 [Caballeronia hypogeia]
MPAVTTKFNADSSIDRAWTAKNVDAQIEAGVDGIIVCSIRVRNCRRFKSPAREFARK